MKIIPERKYKIITNYSHKEFESRLRIELERNNKKKDNFLKSTEVLFKGWIKDDSFIIMRKGYGNTTMIPEVVGSLISGKDEMETELTITVRLQTVTKVFFTIWLSIIGTILLLSIINAFKVWSFNIGIPVSILLFLSGFLLMKVSFMIELETIKRYFREKWHIELKDKNGC